MINREKYSLLYVLFLLTQINFSQNPITKEEGVSDPHIRVFNDTIYLYSGHDSSPEDKLWNMKDWRVFSSTNLLDFTLEETISPKENYMDDNSFDCWASDASTRNGKYYFYFSDKKRGIGVMVSDSPKGPFKDALNKPLVAPMHDPTIFIDDDKNKTPYIIYGDKSDTYYVAALNDDMISTAEIPKPITIHGDLWKNAPNWMDKNYVFKYNNTYYLSWGRDYAVSKNIYGPYQSVGALGKGHHLDEFAHGSFFWWKGQFYHVWCYYLKKGFKFRETIITYCHISDDGKIVTDTQFLDAHFKNGVGQYDASWNVIEAEWFYEKSSEIEKKGTLEKGFLLTNIQNKSWVRFANINLNKQSKIEFTVKNIQGKGELEIRDGSLNGKLLGSVFINSLNQKKETQKIVSTIKKIKGKRDLYFKFIGDHNFYLELDSFKFLE
ncbi:family 43 glycosylhydrolase [Polaribacter butkevichii]|uniref:1,4-beta-xylanase n=1 Tax=Polaribacter butkevichii TaxID=218490 RepID=A0A2P6CCL7_9FLAO|nr:family 43 glycosylhydrolase [Polaribacter butkevichii]PQJ72649.1 1,4-beta-xylanase [Polaribacter butkevichii]